MNKFAFSVLVEVRKNLNLIIIAIYFIVFLKDFFLGVFIEFVK